VCPGRLPRNRHLALVSPFSLRRVSSPKPWLPLVSSMPLSYVTSTWPRHEHRTVPLAHHRQPGRRRSCQTHPRRHALRAFATVNNLSRLRPSRHDRYRVTVFGSARPEPGHWVYEEGQRSGGVLDFFEGDHSPGAAALDFCNMLPPIDRSTVTLRAGTLLAST